MKQSGHKRTYLIWSHFSEVLRDSETANRRVGETHEDRTLVLKDEIILEMGGGDSSLKKPIHTVLLNPIKHGVHLFYCSEKVDAFSNIKQVAAFSFLL